MTGEASRAAYARIGQDARRFGDRHTLGDAATTVVALDRVAFMRLAQQTRRRIGPRATITSRMCARCKRSGSRLPPRSAHYASRVRLTTALWLRRSAVDCDAWRREIVERSGRWCVKLDGVLLDVDGTLVLSVDAHAQAWSDALAEAGYSIGPERVRPLVGMGGDRVLPALAAELNDEDEPGAGIASRRKQIFLERYAPRLEAAPGSRQLLLTMLDDGLRLVVASSAKPEELAVLLDVAGVADLIEAATTSDDAGSSKPAPDIVQAALERSDLAAARVVMLGDTPYDIESAGTAGVGVIALRCGGFPESTLAGALAIYDDPADLAANYERSPLGRAGR